MNPSHIPTTQAVDFVFFYIFGISAVMLIGITAAILFFVVKYHRRRNPRPLPSPHYHIPLETAWTLIPTIIVLSMFYYGWQGYTTLADVPADALTVKVVGRQWSWSFEYPDGRITDRLQVPAGRPVKMEIVSEDVLHSLYVPAFRIKKDAVPGMTTYAWFQAPEPGSFDLFCAEYCGVAHAKMITTVEVMPEDKFRQWYEEKEPLAKIPSGEELLRKHGCLACHSLDGTPRVGPTFKSLFGRQATVLTGEKEHTLTADADYIRRSILNPGFDLVKGFPPIMPSYEGKIPEHELEEIIEYFQEGPEDEQENDEDRVSGEKVAREKGCLNCHTTDGSKGIGPTWKGLIGKEVKVKTDGKERTLTADAEYVKRSITQPQADIAVGFPPVMPPSPDLTEKEVDALVEYIRSLK